MRRWWWRLLALFALVALGAGATAVLPTGTADAHPLGNFTVNHYDGLRLFPDRVELLAVVDYAEIPTLQQRPGVDTDADGAVSAAEGQRRAADECGAVAGAVLASVDGTALDWRVQRTSLALQPGEAGLATTRVECELRAAAALDRPATVEVVDGYLADRIGWREISAAGDGVRLLESTVPAASVTERVARVPGRPAHRAARRALGDAAGGAGIRWRRRRPGCGAGRRTAGSAARRAGRLAHPADRQRRADRLGRGARRAAGDRARRVARVAARVTARR